MAEKRQQTTVTIDTDTGARLERLAKANGVSKKEFISLSLEFPYRWSTLKSTE